MYAAGKIPGSFFKREGRSGEKGTLTARMIDRPIRPLFPKGWHFETQLVSIPLSIDHVHPYDILAMNGASAALMISEVPLPTPVGAVRIGKIDGNFVVNPPEESLLEETDLDLVVAGTEDAILMVEAGRQRDPRGGDPRRARHRARRDQEALRRAARAGREGRQGEARHRGAADRRRPARPDPGLARRAARRGHAGRGQARPPGRHQGRRGGGPRAVLGRPRGRHPRRVPPARAARVRQAREADHPRAHRGPQEAPRRPRRARDPPDHDRGGAAAAHARLGALHARPDAGAERRGAGHAQGGDAPRHPRARDEEVLLAPLQLPALQRGRGGLHARPQAA